MESKAKLFGHAVHPMLIPFPLGLLATVVVLDVINVFADRSSFDAAAAYLIVAGIVGGVAAAIFGWIDWFAIPTGTRAKRVGLVHGLGNAFVLVLFALSWLVRADGEGWDTTGIALVLALVGASVSGVTGWLGGELVERLGVGVDDGAHLDAPSSLHTSTPSTG
jgi:uncharacterized membrane protein